MNQSEVGNYAAVKSFDVLRELGKVQGRTDFSTFYCGRNSDYFSMILRSGRPMSVGALTRITKRLEFEIGNEKNDQVRKKLNECFSSLQAEVMIRLSQQASLQCRTNGRIPGDLNATCNYAMMNSVDSDRVILPRVND
jgi:hypothetical protein